MKSVHLVLGIDVLEVRNDVIAKKLSQGLVLTLQQVEEQLKQDKQDRLKPASRTTRLNVDTSFAIQPWWAWFVSASTFIIQ